jgi:hypothetical protein
MKSFVLQVAIVCIIGSALCQTEPKVPQQFISNITVSLPYYQSPVSFSGSIAIDAINAGAFVDIGGEDYWPISFHTNLVASPDHQGNIDLYMYEGPICWNWGTVQTDILSYYPLQIAPNATSLGNQVIEGQLCSGWSFDVEIFPVVAWVSVENSNLVQLTVDNLGYAGAVEITFFDTVVGPFDPTIYAPPNKVNPAVTCTPSWGTQMSDLLAAGRVLLGANQQGAF